jgi:hypothetical protein
VTVSRHALPDFSRAAAAAVETLLANGLERILCPEIQGKNFRRDIGWIFAYQLAFVSLERRYFEKAAAFHLSGLRIALGYARFVVG